ncbi:MAG TPA: outer membrane beta-barrel protein [Kofleriaceae bacterium]
MRLAGIVAAALLLALPALASARPLSFGVGLGTTDSENDYDGEANGTKQLFGRIGITPRLGIQLELQRIEDPYTDIRTGTALLVVELGRSGNLVPILVAGLGFDTATSDYAEQSGSHKEGGLGLEYRAEGGLTLGVDARLGGRSVDNDYVTPLREDAIGLWAPNGLVEGEYRSARLYAAIRF